jgi:hypothetical protein
MRNNNINIILLILVFTIIPLFHILLPYFSNNLFSTDVWPLYRSTTILIRNPYAKIWNDKLFDGYNNHWPGIILSTAIYIVVTGIDVKITYMYVYTILLSIAIALLLYAFLRRTSNFYGSLLSVIIMGLTPSILIFTSSPLKEVYSYSMFYSIALILALLLSEENDKLANYLAIFILGTGLVISHHLSTYILIGTLISILFVTTINRLKGQDGLNEGNYLGRIFYVASILVILFIMYYYFYGVRGLHIPLSPSSIIIYLVYALVIYGSYIVFHGINRRLLALTVLSIPLIVLILLLLVSNTILLSGIIISLNKIMWYVIAFIPLMLVLFNRSSHNYISVLAVSMSLFVSLNMAYILFGSPLLTSILHRFINYVVLILALLSAGILARRSYLRVIYALTIVLLITSSSIIIIHNIITYNGDVSYFWYYPLPETMGLDTINSLAVNNLTFIGDDKIYYYFISVRSVSTGKLLYQVVFGKGLSNNELLILYYESFRIGVCIGLNTYRFSNMVIRNINRLYDNGFVEAYMK